MLKVGTQTVGVLMSYSFSKQSEKEDAARSRSLMSAPGRGQVWTVAIWTLQAEVIFCNKWC